VNHVMRTLLGAFGFLTILRTPGEPVAPGRAAVFFPFVGAVLGAAGAGIFLGGSRVVPSSVAALLTVAFWSMISGVLHEDGLADVADALRAGRTQEKMLHILKDSRIGTFGAMAVALSVLVRWQALDHLVTSRGDLGILEICVAAQAVPRAAMVALAWVSRPAGVGLGHAFSSTLTTTGAVLAMAQGIAAALLCGLSAAVVMIGGAYVIVRLGRWYFYRRIGGVNGDCLGATEQLLEIFVLLLFTCRNCSW
jgi:adenosylcobinamide-GDP ribazoletransferase